MSASAHVIHYLNAKLGAAGAAALPYEEGLKVGAYTRSLLSTT
jgi:hypothetical protein